MALVPPLLPLHLPRVLAAPSSSSSSLGRRPHHPLTVSISASSSPAEAAAPTKKASALVWFKNDLRIDDHPGLADAVAQHDTVVPFYVFDRRIICNFSDEMLEVLLFSVKDLKKLLKSRGSDLFIGLGDAEEVVLQLVNEVKPSHIYAEEEVEYALHEMSTAVKLSLSATSLTWGSPKIICWKAPLFSAKNLEELPTSYGDFLKMKLPLTNPLPAPTMPKLNVELKSGSLPTFDDIKKYLNEETSESKESWKCLKKLSAMAILRKDICEVQPQDDATGMMGTNVVFTQNKPQNKKIPNSMFASPEGTQVRGGTSIVLDALAAYLRYLEGTGKSEWQELHDKVRIAECRKGASFNALFSSALYFGTISRRRVYFEAIKYEKERNAGFISPFGYSAPTVAASVDAVCSMEWYWLLALQSKICNNKKHSTRIWRWKGSLIQYTAIGSDGPPVLLVHGFGAFLEHFRDNIYDIADGGLRVFAITLLGFGKSEKPNVVYTELMWAELLRDFIIDVVGEPAHLVGNSIGGYIVALVAGLWPTLVKSLVLLNTAGFIVTSYSSSLSKNDRQTSGLAWLQARLLLLYLRSRAANILRNCYPTNTERVDSGLINDILRSSYDPGVEIVLESILNFDLSIPLNHLFSSFGGRVLIIQGMKDPLAKSESFLSMVRQHCSSVIVSELDAGHCPHDEQPEKVNSIILEWTRAL